MWCTAGFLHAAGYTVGPDGAIRQRSKAGDRSVCAFEGVSVTCGDDGVTTWRPEPNSRNRFIFHVRDAQNYPTAMTKAMKSLLTKLP